MPQTSVFKHILFFSLLCSASLIVHAEDEHCVDAQNVIGRVENVLMQDLDFKLKARIDSGAGVSSIHAKIIEIELDKDTGEEVTTFKIADEDGNYRTMRRKVVEWSNIKIKTTEHKERRPVVTLDFCLAGKKIEARVNLANRARFLYPVLIGRNILKTGDFLINPRKKFMQEPTCR